MPNEDFLTHDPISWAGENKKLRSEEDDFDYETKNLMEDGSVKRHFYGAIFDARALVRKEGLRKVVNERTLETNYTVWQAVKSACLAREDVAAIKLTQLKILERLELSRQNDISIYEGIIEADRKLGGVKKIGYVIVALLIILILK